jgi:mediator of RNA polymerase II transcription subunit 16
MVLGNAKWILDLSYYVLDDVFDLADEFESVFSDQEAFAQKGEIEGVLVALYLLK